MKKKILFSPIHYVLGSRSSGSEIYHTMVSATGQFAEQRPLLKRILNKHYNFSIIGIIASINRL